MYQDIVVILYPCTKQTADAYKSTTTYYYWTKMLQSLLNAIRHLHRPWKTAIFKKRQHSLADLSIYMCVPFLKIAISFPGASSKDIKKCKKKEQQIDKNKNPPSSEFFW